MKSLWLIFFLVVVFIVGKNLLPFQFQKVQSSLFYSGPIEGVVRTIKHPSNQRFIRLVLGSIKSPKCIQNKKVLLYWYKPKKDIALGEVWRLMVHMKPPVGSHNLGLFNYENWLKKQNIIAVGYIKRSPYNKRIKRANPNWILEKRNEIAAIISKVVKSVPIENTLKALAVGDRSGLSGDIWQVFQNTGTSHLIAISGLHVGLIFSFSFLCLLFFLRCYPKLALKTPLKNLAVIGSLPVSIFYVLLSGTSITAARAMLMQLLSFTAVIYHKNISIGQSLLIAAGVLLISADQSVFSDSFWLSVTAVAVLVLITASRLKTTSKIIKTLKVQWAITLGLMPLSLFIFHQVSLIGFLINLIAIPWISFLILPIVMLGAIFVLFQFLNLGEIFFMVAGKLLMPLWWLLVKASDFSLSIWTHWIATPTSFSLILLGVFLLLLPKRFVGKWLGVFAIYPLWLSKPPSPNKEGIWLHVFDVGQGLSALIQTAHHALLYDTGPRYPSGFDAGKMIVAPSLSLMGVKHLNAVVVSHGDNDHSGGLSYLLQQFKKTVLYTSAPNLVAKWRGHYCYAGIKWKWDGIVFQFLSPLQNQPYQDNASSCVLKVSGSQGSVLLTGDVERATEDLLIKRYSEKLYSTVLVVPHHGSKTSSTDKFIHFVHPKIALISLGRYNRYHFPGANVLKRYTQIGSKIYRTDINGAISVRLLPRGQVKSSVVIPGPLKAQFRRK